MTVETLVRDFLARLRGRQGAFGRANGTFFSAQVVSTAFQPLRLALMDGAVLNAEGQTFVRGATAWLAWLAHRNFRHRGLKLAHEIQLDEEPPQLLLHAWRQREGHDEHYRQNVLADVEALLLRPPNDFPTLCGHFHPLTSLTLPTPEYLYLYGVFMMQSARAEGNWPPGESLDDFSGGLDADFELSCRLLVDDLHHEAELPVDDEVLRRLSRWVVFPPCGWPMNEGQRYNLMTLIDQIAIRPQLPSEQAVSYLRALLKTQMAFIRHLAVRALMLLDIPPRDAIEARLYRQAWQADDAAEALQAMAELRRMLSNAGVESDEEWLQSCRQHWQAMLDHAPRFAWQDDPILQEDAWQYACSPGLEHAATAMRLLQELLPRYPESWLLRVAIAEQQLSDPETAVQAELTLRQCLENSPDCPDAHLALMNYWHWQGRVDELSTLCRHAVARWPWDDNVIARSMWLMISSMVTFPAES